MERKKALAEYEKLVRKYNLPPLEEVEEEFGILIREPVNFLREFISRLLDRFDGLASHVAGVIQPNRLDQMIEAKFYSDEEKEELLKFMQKLMYHFHLLVASLYEGEKERAKAFLKAYSFYKKEVKKFAKDFLKEQARKWMEEESTREIETYFG